MKRSLAAAALLFLATHAAAAQLLRGSVRDSASRATIGGAVLVLLDSSGRTLGRNITNEQGQFTIALNASMRRVQVLRIGLRPRVVRIPDPVNGEARLDVLMSSIPTLLNAVNVIDQPKCPRRADRQAALALWDQARAALLATVVARQVNPAEMLRLHFDRRVDRRTDSTDRLEVRFDSTSTSRSFIAARDASVFLQRGFVDDAGGFRLFHSPDADVLLDDAFPLGYCFELAAADRARPNQVGLGFRPAERKRGRADIEGVVWIDSLSRSLTDISFRYIGLDPRYERFGAGGRVSFRPMGDGTSLIDRWHIRLLAGAARAVEVAGADSRVGDSFIEVHDRGGEVARARWGDGREWTAALGTIEGIAWHRDKRAPSVHLKLIDTDYRVTTDSAGRFRIPYLLPGPYVFGVIDPILAPLDLTLRTSKFTAVRDSTLRVSVHAPTAAEFVSSSCNAMGRSAGEYTLVGRVLKPDSTPASGAAYEIRILDGPEGTPYVAGRTDEHGTFVVCTVKRTDRLLVSTEHKGLRFSTTRTIVKRIEAVRLQLTSIR